MKRRLKRLVRNLARAQQQAERRSGDQARERGDWSAAAEHYRRHVSRNRSDFDIWVQLGHALKETGRYDEAEQTYAQANEVRPGDADLQLMRGHVAKLRGDPAAAAQFYAMSFGIDGNPFAAAEVYGRHAVSIAATPGTAAIADAVPGVVERIADGVLLGWALNNQDTQEPAEIEILLDDKVICRSLANLRRSDLMIQAGSNRIGFAMDLVGLVDLSQAPSLNVRLRSSGEDLLGSPVIAGASDDIARWSARHDNLSANEIQRLRSRMTTETLGSKVTFILPWEETSENLTKETLDSLYAQWCPHWELLYAVDDALTPGSPLPTIGQDARISIVKVKGATPQERVLSAANTAQGHQLAAIAPGLILEPEAVFRILEAGQSADVAFGDEARFAIAPASVHRIVARPGYCRHTAPTFDFGSLVAVRRELLQATAETRWQDAIRDACERADGIAHIPTVLCRVAELQARSPRVADALETTVEKTSVPTPAPLHLQHPRTLILLHASVRTDVLRDAVEAILATTDRRHADLLIIDEADGDFVRQRYLAGLEKLGVNVDAEASQVGLDDALFSAIVSRRAQYDYVAFIGSAVKPAASGWIEKLGDVLKPDDVGIASGLIFDPWGEKADAGFMLTPGGELVPVIITPSSNQASAPDILTMPDIQARSAIRSSFMMMRTYVFVRLGGFDPELTGRERDADLCLRVARNGLDVLSVASVSAHRLADASQESPAAPSMNFLNRWRRVLVNGDFNAAVQSWDSNWRAPLRLAQLGQRTAIGNPGLARLTPDPVRRLQEDARS